MHHYPDCIPDFDKDHQGGESINFGLTLVWFGFPFSSGASLASPPTPISRPPASSFPVSFLFPGVSAPYSHLVSSSSSCSMVSASGLALPSPGFASSSGGLLSLYQTASYLPPGPSHSTYLSPSYPPASVVFRLRWFRLIHKLVIPFASD